MKNMSQAWRNEVCDISNYYIINPQYLQGVIIKLHATLITSYIYDACRLHIEISICFDISRVS